MAYIKTTLGERPVLAGYWTLTLWPPNYSILIFTHLKLCLADAIHNFKLVKIIQICQKGEVKDFEILLIFLSRFVFNVFKI